MIEVSQLDLDALMAGFPEGSDRYELSTKLGSNGPSNARSNRIHQAHSPGRELGEAHFQPSARPGRYDGTLTPIALYETPDGYGVLLAVNYGGAAGEYGNSDGNGLGYGQGYERDGESMYLAVPNGEGYSVVALPSSYFKNENLLDRRDWEDQEYNPVPGSEKEYDPARSIDPDDPQYSDDAPLKEVMDLIANTEVERKGIFEKSRPYSTQDYDQYGFIPDYTKQDNDEGVDAVLDNLAQKSSGKNPMRLSREFTNKNLPGEMADSAGRQVDIEDEPNYKKTDGADPLENGPQTWMPLDHMPLLDYLDGEGQKKSLYDQPAIEVSTAKHNAPSNLRDGQILSNADLQVQPNPNELLTMYLRYDDPLLSSNKMGIAPACSGGCGR